MMNSPGFGGALALLFFFAVVGMLATIGGIIYAIVWLIQHVRFA